LAAKRRGLSELDLRKQESDSQRVEKLQDEHQYTRLGSRASSSKKTRRMRPLATQVKH
jgi:hypothetical protein